MIGDFRTKDGRCIVAEDRIRLKIGQGGLLGTLREALTSDGIPPARRAGVALFAVAAVVGLVLGARLLPPWLLGAAAGLLLAWVLWSIYRRRQRSAVDVEIPLADVIAVEPQYGLPLLTRPRFVVRYRSEGGVKRRYVLCPSRLYGFGAYKHGKELFEQRGLLTGADEGHDDKQG